MTSYIVLFRALFSDRHEDAIEVVHFDTTTRGVPSLVEAQDIGVTSPLVISGSIMSEGDPSYSE